MKIMNIILIMWTTDGRVDPSKSTGTFLPTPIVTVSDERRLLMLDLLWNGGT